MTAFDHPIVHHGSVEWQLIGEVNAYDMELHDVAMDMFERQSVLFEGSADRDFGVSQVIS